MRLGVRGKLLCFFTIAIVALLIGTLTVIDRMVEKNLRELVGKQLDQNQALLARFQREALGTVEEKLSTVLANETVRKLLVNEESRPRDAKEPMSHVIERQNLQGRAWVFNRKRELLYPPERMAQKQELEALDVVAAAIPFPVDDVSDPPQPPERISPQVIQLGGSLWVLVTGSLVEMVEGERESVGAVIVADDLGRLADELRTVAGGEADVAVVAGRSVLRTTLPAARRGALETQLAQQAETLAAVERGEQSRALLELVFEGQTYVCLATPVSTSEQGSAPGTMLIIRPLDAELDAQMERIRTGVLLTGLVALLLTLAAGAVFARSLTRPIAALAQGMLRVADGDLDLAVPRSSQCEIGDLTEQFNEMVVGLRQKEMFKRMVSSSAVKEVEERGRTRQILKLGGEIERVTVLFSDIRNFTPMTEQLGPKIVTLLNAYFAVAGKVIASHGGDIDKFIGDAVMIVFRDGDDGPGPLKAVRCAAAMCQSLPDFNATMLEQGLPEIAIGVGIATGDAVAGNVGTPDRMENTVLGDTVNVAARLEGESKISQHLPIMIDKATYESVAGEVEVSELSAKLKGKSGALDIFELRSVTPRPEPEPEPTASDGE